MGFEEPAPSAVPVAAPEGAASFAKVASRGRGAAGGAKRVVYGPTETFAYVYHRMMPAYTVVHR